jgi:hypothetical protein
MFSGDGDGTIRAANDGTLVVKRIVLAKVNDETGVLGAGGKGDGGADLNAEGLVVLGVGDTRLGGGVAASAAPDINGARLRLISMVQGEEAEPQVLAAAQMLALLDAEQTSFLTFFLVSWLKVRSSGKTNKQHPAAT